jgi:hypothetical protein
MWGGKCSLENYFGIRNVRDGNSWNFTTLFFIKVLLFLVFYEKYTVLLKFTLMIFLFLIFFTLLFDSPINSCGTPMEPSWHASVPQHTRWKSQQGSLVEFVNMWQGYVSETFAYQSAVFFREIPLQEL